MPRRSKATELPPAVKKWLDEQLAANSFSDYGPLATELKARGFDISRSALHRYGSKLEKTMALAKATVDKARAVVEAAPDEDDAMTAAILRLTQQNVLELLMAMEFDPESAKDVDMSKLTLQVSRLVRSAIPLKNYQREARERAKAAAGEIAAEAKKLGASADTIKTWREKVMGVAEK